MSHHKLLIRQSRGFTLIELVITFAVVGVISTAAYSFFNTSISQYLALHKDSVVFGDLATQSQRIANVMRGLTGIVSADANDITVYAYFAPNDTYVSKIRYYKNVEGTKLFADVTQMTSNPPVGTEVAGSLKTYTIINNFHSIAGLDLFDYYDASNSEIVLPIPDLNTVKIIRVNLAVPSKRPVASSDTTMTVEVALRNRKTNL